MYCSTLGRLNRLKTLNHPRHAHKQLHQQKEAWPGSTKQSISFLGFRAKGGYRFLMVRFVFVFFKGLLFGSARSVPRLGFRVWGIHGSVSEV